MNSCAYIATVYIQKNLMCFIHVPFQKSGNKCIARMIPYCKSGHQEYSNIFKRCTIFVQS